MMSDANQDMVPTAMRAGADLRAARERLGWDLAEIAAGLRIRLPYLEALEDGRLELLPGPAYALGFVRTYATALGLDPDEVVRRFKAEAGEVNARTELSFPAPVPERGIPAGAVVLLGLVLAVGAYAGWYHLSGEGRLPAETTAVPERLAPLAEQALPPVPSAPKKPVQVATAKPVPADPASAADSGMQPAPDAPADAAAPATAAPQPQSIAAADKPVMAVGPTQAAAAELPPAAPAPAVVATSPAAQATPDTASPITTTAPTPAAPGAPPLIVLHASADSWVQVRDKSGQVLLNRILHPGDSWQVPDRPNLLLTTGNAGGTELVVNGVSTGVLGSSGAVRRDLPLNAEAIQDGRLASPNGGVQRASLRSPQQ